MSDALHLAVTAPSIHMPPVLEEAVSVLPVILVIALLAVTVKLYATALHRVRTGELVVYRDWADFGKSALWVVALPCGLGWLSDGSRILGVMSTLIGCGSILNLCWGAFTCNDGKSRWLALYARFAVVLLLVFALGKLNEKFQQYKRHEVGAILGVLLPLVLFAWIFESLIRPMVGSGSRPVWRRHSW